MTDNTERMEELVSALDTKSAKIRKLAAAGYSRRQIADFLGVRYQFVRNVLVEESRKHKQASPGFAEPKRAWRSEPSTKEFYGGTRILPDGSAVIPSAVLAEAGLHPGESFVTEVAGEGDVRLLSGLAAIRRAQELVRELIPEGVDLLEELRQDRRRQAGRENRLAGDLDDSRHR